MNQKRTAMRGVWAGVLGCGLMIVAAVPVAAGEQGQPAAGVTPAGPARMQTTSGLVAGPAEPHDWEVRWSVLNRSSNVDLASGRTNYNINLSGKLYVPADARVVNVAAAEVTDALVEGQSGSSDVRNDIVQAFQGKTVSTASGGMRRYWQPMGLNGGNADHSVPVNVSLSGQGEAPRRYTRIRGQVPLLLAKEVKTVEVDSAQLAQGKPIELLPGWTISQGNTEAAASPRGGMRFIIERTDAAATADAGAAESTGPRLFAVEALDPSGGEEKGSKAIVVDARGGWR